MGQEDEPRSNTFRSQYRELGPVRKFTADFFGWPPYRPQDRQPPELPGYKVVLLWIADGVLIFSALFISYICLTFVFKQLTKPDCACYLYLSGLVFLFSFILDRILRHPRRVHEERLEDRSEVEALIVEGRGVQVRHWDDPNGERIERPRDFEDRRKRLFSEIDRLEKEGPHTWTEYQIVPLYQILVEFLSAAEVVARTRSLLAELEDYASDSSYRYESRNFERLKDAVDAAISRIDDIEKQIIKKKEEPPRLSAAESAMVYDAARILRAELCDMYDHLAGYRLEWAQGSALIRGLLVCGAVSVIVFLGIGTIPWFYFSQPHKLGGFDWAYLGAAGAITSLLLSYYKYRLVEVGNTEGKQELLRATLAGVLGLVAGIVSFTLIWFDIIRGDIIPVLGLSDPKNIAGSIVFAFGAGFVFESIFEKLKQSVGTSMN